MEPGVRKAAPGRLPERVYWFRRAIVLIGLALVIALLMWLVSLLGGGPQTAPPRRIQPFPRRPEPRHPPTRSKPQRSRRHRRTRPDGSADYEHIADHGFFGP